MKKIIQKIKHLNKAFTDFSKALSVIENNIQVNSDVETHLWRIKKAFEAIQKESMKQIDKETIENEFKNITKKFKRKKI